MWRAWWFRLGLLTVLAAVVVVVAVNYSGRSDQFREAVGAVLAPDITRRSTEFDYTQLKEGGIAFQVRAEASTLTRSGEHQLEVVDLVRFGPDGSPGDRISAQRAVYRVAEKHLEFSGEVEITLEDGTRVLADAASADLDREVVDIRTGFRFSQGDVTGSGGVLSYVIQDRRLEFRDGLEVAFPSARGSGGALAAAGTYSMPERTIAFRGDAVVWAGKLRLNARDIQLEMDEGRNLESLAAAGKAAFESAGERFAGERIELQLAGRPEERDRVTVWSGQGPQAGGPRTPASFRQHLDGQSLTGGRIDALLSGLGRERIEIETLAASDQVQLALPNSGSIQARSDHFRAEAGSGQGFRAVILSGAVRMTRSVEKQVVEDLSADRLRLQFDPSGLESATASGKVAVRMVADGVNRLAEADQEVRIDYREGRPVALTSKSNCRLQSAGPDQVANLAAPRIGIRFRDGQPDTFSAEGGAEIELRASDGVRESRSQVLTGRFAEGRIAAVEQQGDFFMQMVEGDSRIEMAGAAGTYDVASGGLQFGGEPGLLRVFDASAPDALPTLTTRAQRFTLSRGFGSVVAEGEVESVVQGQDAPVVVAAGRLEGNEETGWAEYSGAPRLIQGQNQVSGERIRLNRESREFVVEGAVDSLLIDQEGDEPRSYRVFAGRMERPGTGQPVVYEEAVQLVTEGLQLQAPRLLLMPGEAQPDAFERVVAEGGVEIDENGRKWRGRKATYLIASRRLVVGN